ncbi:MAG: polysaccharide biosynthesis/export family protein [Acidobacteriota bacterium]
MIRDEELAMTIWWSLILTVFMILSPRAFGQKAKIPGYYSNARGFANEKSQTLNTTAFLRMSKISLDYKLGSGDVLRIEITGQNELNQHLQAVRITNTGDISLPYIGLVHAADLTAAELEERIAAGFEERQLMQQPDVLVYVTDYQSKPIFVLGEVDNPGEYVMTQELTFTEAILMAGGIDFGADRYGFLHRRVSEPTSEWKPPNVIDQPDTAKPGGEIIKIDLEPLKNGGVLKPDTLLRKGDVIVIPSRKPRVYFVIGDVTAPGPYEIGTQPLLVSRAIANAGGPRATAKTSKGLLVRYKENGLRDERRVDFTAILKGEKPDFEVLAKDIIFIPGSHAKSLGYGLLGIIPSTVMQQTSEAVTRR